MTTGLPTQSTERGVALRCVIHSLRSRRRNLITFPIRITGMASAFRYTKPQDMPMYLAVCFTSNKSLPLVAAG